jgi:hypothetical protein
MTLQKHHLAVPTVQEAQAAGNTSDVDVDQHPVGELACGEHLPQVYIPNAPFPVARPDASLGEE